jgi:hypothetical protein
MAKKRLKKKAYDPLDPSFRYQSGFNKAVNKRANSEVKPLLQGVGVEARDQAARHRQRTTDLTNWGNFENNARTAASDRVNSSLNHLITTNAGLSGASADALNAALRSAAAPEQQAAANLGVESTYDPSASIAAGRAGQDVAGLGLISQFGNLSAASARDIGVAATGMREAATNEDRRFGSIEDQLDKQRRDIRARIPDLREQARSAIQQEEMGKAGQRFQQDLATDQFGLSKKQFRLQKRGQKFQEGLASRQQDETERQGRSQRSESRSRLRLDQGQLDLQRETLRQNVVGAATDEERKNAEAAAKQFDSGVEILNEFFKPTKAEQRKDGRLRDSYGTRTTHGYDDLLARIMATTGMGEVMARRVLLTAPNDRWRNRANREIANIKRLRNRQKAHHLGANQRGGPHGTGRG